MRFRDEYWFLSNMYPCPVTVKINGVPMTFQSSEAAFQAAKNPARATEFVNLDGFAAKKLGFTVGLRPDWTSVRLDCMRCAVWAKFSQNPELARKLKAITGEIREENTWNDKFWGVCNGHGQNWLGRILMETRNKL